MTILTRPMLAAKLDPSKQRYPCLGSVKIDGIRCLIRDGVAYSRKLKPIPNKFVQAWAEEHHTELEGFDGELGIDEMNAPDFFRRTTSGVMSEDGRPDFTYYVFDLWDMPSINYARRLVALQAAVRGLPRVKLVVQSTIFDAEMMQGFLERHEKKGHEGIMLRDPSTKYKFGRATPNSQELVKVKTMESAEAEVIGFEEQMHNANEATISETGRTKRSSHKENMIPKGTLGALVCRRSDGVEFNIGTGFDDATRALIWHKRKKYLGASVTYKFFPQGAKDKPRFPTFVGFRED